MELYCLVYAYVDCRPSYFLAMHFSNLVTNVLVVIGDVFFFYKILHKFTNVQYVAVVLIKYCMFFNQNKIKRLHQNKVQFPKD